jgi:hypothetical protein
MELFYVLLSKLFNSISCYVKLTKLFYVLPLELSIIIYYCAKLVELFHVLLLELSDGVSCSANFMEFFFSLLCKACEASPFLVVQSLQSFFVSCCVELAELFYVLHSKLTKLFYYCFLLCKACGIFLCLALRAFC